MEVVIWIGGYFAGVALSGLLLSRMNGWWSSCEDDQVILSVFWPIAFPFVIAYLVAKLAINSRTKNRNKWG